MGAHHSISLSNLVFGCHTLRIIAPRLIVVPLSARAFSNWGNNSIIPFYGAQITYASATNNNVALVVHTV